MKALKKYGPEVLVGLWIAGIAHVYLALPPDQWELLTKAIAPQ